MVESLTFLKSDTTNPKRIPASCKILAKEPEDQRYICLMS